MSSLAPPPLRVAINGFGRIGRLVLRAWVEQLLGLAQPTFLAELTFVAVNDLWDAATLAHLLQYDSTHGRFPAAITATEDALQIHLPTQTLTIRLFNEPQPLSLPWQTLEIDVVLECSGQFRSRTGASQHLTAGAQRVIVGAAPFDTVDAAIVIGVNEATLASTDRIISSVSCTTQALVPLVALLDEAFGIESALMTEIHAVTADQTVLDQGHRDWRRARASGYNIIPTTSSAIGALKRVMPQMAGRIEGYSIRVPTLNVAAIDLSVVLQQSANAEDINMMLTKAATGRFHNIMRVEMAPLVSSDFNHQPYSLVIDGLQTQVVGRQAKILAWYDNEWGYANRLLDLCALLQQMPATLL